MMRTHQQGAGQPFSLQQHQALLCTLLYIATEQHAVLAIADAHHATVVITAMPRTLWPQHRKRQPLPAPLLATVTQSRHLSKIE